MGDRALYEKLVTRASPLLAGVDLGRLAKSNKDGALYGLPPARFAGRPGGANTDAASLVTDIGSVTAIRLPAALLAEREFAVDVRVEGASRDQLAYARVQATPPSSAERWEGSALALASADGAGYGAMVRGNAEFRKIFPLYLCFPAVVPNDEVVSLKMYHREDEPLERLFLDEAEQRRLDRLWEEHRFITRQAAAENSYLPLFIGFVTQDQPPEMVAHFESLRPSFQKRADALLRDEATASARQLDALDEFAGRAFRRPLDDRERSGLRHVYQAIRDQGAGHEEAFRGALLRIFVSPAFLYRIEHAPPGVAPAPVDDWELATRLSYFLWSSAPDQPLRDLAAAGRLHQPDVLAAQARRMLDDGRVRSLAIEFGAQWVNVRGFDGLNEKNETLFPTFDPELRAAIYEETILFFQSLFQGERPVTDLLDADYTFLNGRLAGHYGVPGVTGPQWRRVDGVRKYGRGGLLGLASIQAKESGASRTSPVLRGNWVVETLLGEKLPRPPADVPKIPDAEGEGGLTVRQQLERHVSDPSCAVCHVRIDPFGLAFERYDPIGRLRTKDLAGLPIDSHARLKDGAEFDGLDGLRSFLLKRKREVIVRLFCKRLLGYALGRSVALSDQPLIDEMTAAAMKDGSGGTIAGLVQKIVRSPQFTMIRGADYAD